MRRSPHALRAALASFIGLSLVLFLIVGTASAHAKVIDSNPKMGSTVAQAPTTITVTTAENMKPGAQFSDLFVYGPSGDLVSQGDAKIPLFSSSFPSPLVFSSCTRYTITVVTKITYYRYATCSCI